MDINFISKVFTYYETGERYWKRHAPEARDEFENVIALCEERNEYPDQYIQAIAKLIEINTALDNKEKATYYQSKLDET